MLDYAGRNNYIIMYVEDSMMPFDLEHLANCLLISVLSRSLNLVFFKALICIPGPVLFCISAVDCHQLCIMNTISPQILMVVRMSKVKEKKGYKCKRTFA